MLKFPFMFVRSLCIIPVFLDSKALTAQLLSVPVTMYVEEFPVIDHIMPEFF